MPFCTHCGHETPEGALFCESCGARQDDAARPAAPAPQEPPQGAVPPPAPGPAQGNQAPPPPAYGGQPLYGGQQPGRPAAPPPYGAPAYGQPAAAAPKTPAAPKQPRKPLPKGAKIGIIAGAALVAVCAVVCIILNKVNDPQKTIRTFVNSIITRDAGAFRSVTTCAAPDIVLTEESVAPFLSLYSGNTSMLNTFQDALTADLQLLEQGADSTGSGLVRLVQEDHVIFKSYSVELSTVKATFTSPLPNARATVAGKTLELPAADREYSVNILPGRYEVRATATDAAFGTTFTYENSGLKVGASGITSALEFEYATVVLTRQDLEPTSLSVNGKDCPIPTFDDYGTAFLSPLPVDAQLTATFDYAGIVFTASFTCDGPNQRYFYLDPVLDEDCARSLLNTAAEFTNDWLQRYADGDADGIQALCDGKSSLLSSLAYQLRKSQNPNLWRYVYRYTLHELEGDLALERSSDFYADNSPCFSTLLFLSLDYTEEYLPPASYQPSGPETPSEPEAYNQSMMVKVYIQYKDGVWQVVNYDRTNNVSRSSIVSPLSLM